MLEKIQLFGGLIALVAIVGGAGTSLIWDRMDGIEGRYTLTLFNLAVAAGTLALHKIWPRDEKPVEDKEQPAGIIVAEKKP